MYLSRLLLDPRLRQVQRETGDPYQLHRTIMQAFPETLPEGERILHRLDVNARTGQIILLVQSHSAPDWAALTEKAYLLPVDPFSGLDNPAVKPLTLSLQPAQRLRFRLRANPTIRVPRDDPERNLKKGQQIGLLKEEEQMSWLKRKGDEDGGFAVLGVNIVNEGFSSGKTKNGDRFKHFSVCFDGMLQVTNPDRLIETIRRGIGRGKGLGFGLLSIAKA